MPKVKIIYANDLDEVDYGYPSIVADMTDWEDVSDEDIALLQNNMNMDKFNPYAKYRLYPRLVIQDTIPVVTRIATVKAKIAEIAQAKAEAEKKMQEKKKLKKKKELQKKKALLQQLKQELGES